MAKGPFRITCITKDDRYNPYEQILSVGGTAAGGWTLSQQTVINRIKDGTESFYVEEPSGDRVRVIVAESRFGNDYIKTEADSDHPNNLLSLPKCP